MRSSKSSETTAGDRRQLRDRSHLHGHRRRWKQLFGHQTIVEDTAPEFTFVPADYTVECSDEMPMDDATASDNCGGHHRGVGKPLACRGSLRAPSRPPTTLETALRPPNHHRGDTTAPEFTFVPADYTVECSDEMPMEDATAWTTAVSHHRMSSETTAGTPATT